MTKGMVAVMVAALIMVAVALFGMFFIGCSPNYTNYKFHKTYPNDVAAVWRNGTSTCYKTYANVISCIPD